MDPFDPLADVLLIVVSLVTVGYLASCVIWPFRGCRRCAGMGHISGPVSGIRLCRHCDATGLRLRLGRRLWNTARRLHRDINNVHNH